MDEDSERVCVCVIKWMGSGGHRAGRNRAGQPQYGVMTALLVKK